MRSVVSKLRTTVLLQKPSEHFLDEPDLTGPLMVTSLLGFFLLLVR